MQDSNPSRLTSQPLPSTDLRGCPEMRKQEHARGGGTGDVGSCPWCGLWSRLGRNLHVGEAPIQGPHVLSSTLRREMDRLGERVDMQGSEEQELWSLVT